MKKTLLFPLSHFFFCFLPLFLLLFFTFISSSVFYLYFFSCLFLLFPFCFLSLFLLSPFPLIPSFVSFSYPVSISSFYSFSCLFLLFFPEYFPFHCLFSVLAAFSEIQSPISSRATGEMVSLIFAYSDGEPVSAVWNKWLRPGSSFTV